MTIKLINLKKKFPVGKKSIPALNNINLDINDGDFISFVGSSGAGKSTLLLLIAGLIKPSEGDIYFDSKKVTKLPDKEWSMIRKHNLGMIFQKKVVVSHLKVYENLIAPLSLNKSFNNFELVQDEINHIMEVFDLLEIKGRYPDELSGGELQRLIVARALITKPKVLLADEPTGDLDNYSSNKLLNTLVELNKKGLTIVLVSHDNKIADISKSVYELQKGEIVKIVK